MVSRWLMSWDKNWPHLHKSRFKLSSKLRFPIWFNGSPIGQQRFLDHFPLSFPIRDVIEFIRERKGMENLMEAFENCKWLIPKDSWERKAMKYIDGLRNCD